MHNPFLWQFTHSSTAFLSFQTYTSFCLYTLIAPISKPEYISQTKPVDFPTGLPLMAVQLPPFIKVRLNTHLS